MMTRITTHAGVAYWQVGNEIYSAPETAGIDTQGRPMGARFLCYESAWTLFKRAYGVA
jgi:hypothetical protein